MGASVWKVQEISSDDTKGQVHDQRTKGLPGHNYLQIDLEKYNMIMASLSNADTKIKVSQSQTVSTVVFHTAQVFPLGDSGLSCFRN